MRVPPPSTLFPYTTLFRSAAAFNLTLSLRGMLAGRGISVHAIMTGFVDTDMTEGFDALPKADPADVDRKSTRLNSSHMSSSYAVFCLKKKAQSAAVWLRLT